MSELNWLPLSLRKNIDLPKVYFEPYDEELTYGGYYQPDTNLKNCYMVIVEPPSWLTPRDTESTLAHEFCHHLQWLRNDFPKNPARFDTSISYEDAITKYFRNCRHEYECLLFQTKYANNESHHWWLNKLVNPKKVKNV